ncbi:hypothetical protein LHU53_12695 [Rhodoferax sp. U2-2l]|uniref:hypothetical protein n=1 Tax=Rhodoferax sp. U2-2l TaxID=2884000 RepID=UPI001D0AB5BD|nr:hypothetical protein [Rhodoferax sp. U2-2l]MCB8747761.1 hypothetical protein [Rhodoferax sp. U2-2l]
MTRVQWFWKMSFWTLVMATLWLSLVPVHHIPSAFSFWDKAQHALGFTGLAFLGLMAYPGRLARTLSSLMLLGAGIELVQALTGWRKVTGRTGWRTVRGWSWGVLAGIWRRPAKMNAHDPVLRRSGTQTPKNSQQIMALWFW